MRIRHLVLIGVLAHTTLAAPPPLVEIAPNYDVAGGGRTVVIEAAEAFAGTLEDYQVTFGTAEADVLGIDETSLSVLVPAGAAPGLVDVTVTDLGDSASSTVPGGFYYITGPPSISRVVDPDDPDADPPIGSTRGGHAVIVQGTGLSFTTAVEFGGIAAPPESISVLSDTQVAVETPPSTAGLKSVGVQVAPGNLETFTSSLYRYANVPQPEQIFPAVGASMGGSTTTIFGSVLSNVTSVTFGGVPATITVNTSDRIEVIVAAHPAGTVDVVVSNAVDSATLPNAFTFFDPPVVSSINPIEGPASGGNNVTIQGTNLLRLLDVRFAGIKATTSSITDTQIIAQAPAHNPGTVTLEVRTVGGVDTASYTYVARPIVESVSPVQGSTRGGYAVTIEGLFLNDPVSVFFGSNPATILDSSDTEVMVLVPARASLGTVPVSVATRGGTGTLNNAFTYVRGVGVDSVTPARGFTTGGETVTLKGTGFEGLQSVWIGGMPCLVSAIEGTTEILVISPPGAEGFADVEVRTIADNFTQPSAYEYVDPQTPFGSLRGIVTDTNSGDALSRAIVVARLGGMVVGTGASDANGEFLITSLEPGEYSLEVFPIGFQRDTANATIIAGEEETINFAVAPLPVGGGTVAGRVTEFISDSPMVGARVQAIHSTGIITTYTCGDGTYDLPGIPLGVSLNVTVAVTAPGYDPQEREVMIGNQLANFIMNRGLLPGKFGGSVFDATNDAPLLEAQVLLIPTLGMVGHGRATNASGGFSFRNLDYATYDLRVSAPGYDPHFQNVTLATVAGQQIVIKLTPAGTGGPGCAGGTSRNTSATGDILAIVAGLLGVMWANRRRRSNNA